MMKVLIAAGGTGGHLFPAVRLAEELRSRFSAEVLFITSRRKQDREILEEKGMDFRTVPVSPFQSGGVLAVLRFAIRLVFGTMSSGCILFRFRPSSVVGFGGYVSGPVLLLAALFRIKTVIHEQNVYPGKTNRILAVFVDRIAVSFRESLSYLKRFESKVVVSGNLLRRDLKPEEKVPKEGGMFTVLALGGSQGSHALNRLIPEAVDLLQGREKDILDMIHISGHRERAEVEKVYRDKGIKSRVLAFTHEISRFYNECDFVIARAGATTVSELLHLGKPSILIPYPHADAHQRLNAGILVSAGSAVLLEEDSLTAEGLRDAVARLMDREVLKAMSEGSNGSANGEAADVLIKEITG